MIKRSKGTAQEEGSAIWVVKAISDRPYAETIEYVDKYCLKNIKINFHLAILHWKYVSGSGTLCSVSFMYTPFSDMVP